MKKQISIFDTTLRDGTQCEEISYTVEDKLLIAQKLDELGVHYIEGGWPGANPKDSEFFERAAKELKLKNATLVAFGSTRRARNKAEDDRVLKAMLAANTKAVCLFGKTWDLHVRRALNISLEENLEIIQDSIAFLKKHGKEVVYDAEHFFDGYKDNKSYALKTLKAAAKGGASWLVLCDTNGGTLPDEITKIVQAVKKKIRKPLGIHCHNDSGVAVANSLAAVQAGARQVQGTINGIGERCGNANLVTIMADLELKMGYATIGPRRLTRLTETSRLVNELANLSGDTRQPYVGPSAFAHKGGVHVDAILKDSRTYEHIQPQKVGNAQRILVSDLSGSATVVHKAKKLGVDLTEDKARVRKVLAKLKEMENQGYVFEGAEASFEMMIKRQIGKYKPPFKLHDFEVKEVITEEGGDYQAKSRAKIHLSVNGQEEQATATGVGPVHAIDQAFRSAIKRFYPQIAEVKLLDYKVRVLPADQGTASFVRVLIEFGDGLDKWATVGVSENIIFASFKALLDSVDYKLMKENQ